MKSHPGLLSKPSVDPGTARRAAANLRDKENESRSFWRYCTDLPSAGVEGTQERNPLWHMY